MIILSRLFLKLISIFIVLLPIKVQFFFGDIIGLLWFDVLRIRRQVVLSNLKLAYPDMPEKERVRIGRAALKNLGRSFVEFLRLPFVGSYDFKNDFQIQGMEHLH